MDHNKRKFNSLVGKRIKEAIAISPYTFEELADLLHLTSPRVIYEWVNGNKMPNIFHLCLLKELLNISIDEILAN